MAEVTEPAITYLDHAASTPMRAEAVEAMMPYFSELYANPSGSHRFARRARQAVDEARDVVANVVGCHPNEAVFTGCGYHVSFDQHRHITAGVGGVYKMTLSHSTKRQ